MITQLSGFSKVGGVRIGRVWSAGGEIEKRWRLGWLGGRYARVGGVYSKVKASAGKGEFEIVQETEMFKRYQTVYKRDIRYPNGRVVSFDITANSASEHKSVFVFPFCTKTRTATLLREYEPGQNRETMSVVAGMYEADKHEDMESAARAELHEEAGLRGGRLITVAENVAADKYSMNKFYYYLALDCEAEEIGERDAEEWIEVVGGLSLERVREIVESGHMNAPNSVMALLALEQLRRMGFD